MSDHEPTFAPDEVSALLRAAAERQAAGDRREQKAAAHHVLTLEEIEAVAAEAGIEPRHVRAAAEAGALEETAAPPPANGAGTVEERLVEGLLSDAQWEALVVALRERFDVTGTVSQFGARREWTAKGIAESTPGPYHLGPLPDLHLEVRREEGMTRLRFTDRSLSQKATLGTTAAGLLAMTVIMATVGAINDGFTAATFLLSWLLIIACTFATYQFATSRWHRRRERRLEAALDYAEELCNRSSPERSIVREHRSGDREIPTSKLQIATNE